MMQHVTVTRIRAEGGLWVFACRCGYQTAGHYQRYDADDAMRVHLVEANACPHPVLDRLVHEGDEDYCLRCSTWFVKENA